MPAPAHDEGPKDGDQPFGADYYRRFYGDARTRVSDQREILRLATFVASYLGYLQVPVRSILDIGCGVGHWQKACAKLWPKARYHGVEYSQYLCDRHGWHQGSIVDLDPEPELGRATFDLVVCQGVLQYLDDRDAAAALDNLARWTDGALYLEALTQRDWDENCDRSVTDGEVHLRSGSFYRERLREHFQDCGGGVFCARRAGVALFELEGE
ncbi:MAG: class I SAM-dependent methyltransferase [Planctomycetes bacterium]|nr:class I SAM-dependent methyltransferase [Planctomycetota bacterium]